MRAPVLELEPVRLFAALPIPDEVREHAVTALRPIHHSHDRALRWTDPDNWHITLSFYGDQPDDCIDDVCHHLLYAAAMGPLDISLKGAGCFSGRTLWLGVGGRSKDVGEMMARAALPYSDGTSSHPDGKRRPHMTVARARDPRNYESELVLRDAAHALSVYEGPTFTADYIAIMASYLGRGVAVAHGMKRWARYCSASVAPPGS